MPSSVRATWCARISSVADRSVRIRRWPKTAIRPMSGSPVDLSLTVTGHSSIDSALGQDRPGQVGELADGRENRRRPGHQRQPALGQFAQPIGRRRPRRWRSRGLEPAVNPHLEQRVALRVRAEQGVDRVLDRAGDGGHVAGGHQGQAGLPEHPFPVQRATVRRGRVPQPGQHQQVQDRGEHRDHADVRGRALGHRDEQHDRRDQRREHEQGQPAGRDLALLPGHRLGQRGHRRVQRGGAPGGVEQGPAEIDDGPVVERPVQLDRVEGHVGHQAPEGAEGEELDAPGPARPRREQPHDQRQREHVAERIGDRHDFLQPVQVRIVHIGPDQEGPRQQRETGRERQRVDQAAPVLVGGPALDEDQKRDRIERKGQQVERVGKGGKGQHHAPLRRNQEAQLAGRETRLRGGEHEPRGLARGTVEYDARHDRDDPAEADQTPGLEAQPGQPVVRRDQEHHPDRVAAENIPLQFHGNPPALVISRLGNGPQMDSTHPSSHV